MKTAECFAIDEFWAFVFGLPLFLNPLFLAKNWATCATYLVGA